MRKNFKWIFYVFKITFKSCEEWKKASILPHITLDIYFWHLANSLQCAKKNLTKEENWNDVDVDWNASLLKRSHFRRWKEFTYSSVNNKVKIFSLKFHSCLSPLLFISSLSYLMLFDLKAIKGISCFACKQHLVFTFICFSCSNISNISFHLHKVWAAFFFLHFISLFAVSCCCLCWCQGKACCCLFC